MVDAGNGKIALKGYADNVPASKYVCSETGGLAMSCNRDVIGDWEKFDWISNADGSISLKGNNGQYVTGSSPMWYNSSSIGNNQKFYWIQY